MSFFNKIIKSVYESVLVDQFTQLLNQQQVIAVINKYSISKSYLSPEVHAKSNQLKVYQVTQNISEFSLQLQIRSLGFDPSVQIISKRITSLKDKLQVVQQHLLSNKQTYLETIQKGIEALGDVKSFFITRKKTIETRNILERLKNVLQKGKSIARLNIRLNNIKKTIKLLQKVPNIKKMGLTQLKAIDLNSLQKINLGIQLDYGKRLLCLDNLKSYVKKVDEQEFMFIIDMLKLCLDNYEAGLYTQVISNYVLINPNIPLDRLFMKLIEEKIRHICDLSIAKPENIIELGEKLIALIICLHKIIKWHKVNQAFRTCISQEQNRRRSVSIQSNNSQEGPILFQLTDVVLIDPILIKSSFSQKFDEVFSDLISDEILERDGFEKKFKEYLYLIARINQLIYRFTGSDLVKIRKNLYQHMLKRQQNVFLKCQKDFIQSLQQEKNQWNRLPFLNNYRNKLIDRQIFKLNTIYEKDEFQKIQHTISRFMQSSNEKSSISTVQSENQEDQPWELRVAKFPSFEKVDRQFQAWRPSEQYLKFYEGDVILCQSSFKIMNIFERYLDLLSNTPRGELRMIALDHVLLLVQYELYYLFNLFLSQRYKNIFFGEDKQETVQSKYTKSRIAHLNPCLAKFTKKFKNQIMKCEQSKNNKDTKLFALFKKEVKEANGQANQILRAKVIACSALKFAISYLQQIFNAAAEKHWEVVQRLDNCKQIIEQLSLITLTESTQKMVGLEMDTIKSLFQNIQWDESYEDLKQYIKRIQNIFKQCLNRLKGSLKGEVPNLQTMKIFILIWRTLLTYSIKLFLQTKNIKKDHKLNFQRFIDQIYKVFHQYDVDKSLLNEAYLAFKTIFPILLSNEWQTCKEKILESTKRFDYIFNILMAVFDNCQFVQKLSERQRERYQKQIKNEIDIFLNSKIQN